MIGRLFRRQRIILTDTDSPNTSPIKLPFSTDLHSHLIPGIDDGAPDLETSLQLLGALEKIGYRRLVTTPHVMADSYRNSSTTIRIGLEKLRHAARQADISLEIEAAAEYYMDEELQRRVKEGDILTIGERYLLFETSYFSEPLYLEERIYEINLGGYTPLLAHPERYRYIRNYARFYGRLRELGVLFQCNINSFGGHYGRDAQAKAHWLADQGWIDFLGSDLHHIRQAEFLHRIVNSGVLEKICKNNEIKNDTLNFSPS